MSKSSRNNSEDDNNQLPAEQSSRQYNEPDLPPMEFLLAVMHDPRVPMAARIDAAKAVSVYMHPRLAQITQEVSTGIRIVIEGGLPELPGTTIIMPEYEKPQRAGNGKGED